MNKTNEVQIDPSDPNPSSITQTLIINMYEEENKYPVFIPEI